MGAYSLVDFKDEYRSEVISLWRRCDLVKPWNDPDKDIDRKQSEKTGRFLILLSGETPVGSVMVGYDGHRGSIFYLCVDPAHQSQGCGRMVMEYCEKLLTELGCPKINLMVRNTNLPVIEFYERMGYIQDQVVVLGKRLIPDD